MYKSGDARDVAGRDLRQATHPLQGPRQVAIVPLDGLENGDHLLAAAAQALNGLIDKL